MIPDQRNGRVLKHDIEARENSKPRAKVCVKDGNLGLRRRRESPFAEQVEFPIPTVKEWKEMVRRSHIAMDEEKSIRLHSLVLKYLHNYKHVLEYDSKDDFFLKK